MQDNDNQSQELNTPSDYDAEWGLDDDSPTTPAVVNTAEDSPTIPADTASAAVALEKQESITSEGVTAQAAESDSDTTWANATPEQLKALQKAENDEKAMRGRFRLSTDKAVMLEKQLNELRTQNAELIEKTREPTQFEKDHPEYAEDLNKLYGKQGGESTPTSDDPADAILSAHADAGEVYNSNEFQIWISAQPKPVRQAIEASDAESIIDILTQYKQAAPPQAETPATQAGLQGIADAGGSSAQVDLRSASSLSTAEQYEAEWATD